MKRNIAFAVVITLLLLISSGCDFWTVDERTSVETHVDEQTGTDQQSTKITGYSQMRNFFVSMIENGIQSGLMDVSEFTGGSVRLYTEAAIRYARNSTPMGNYAVEAIDFEVGTRSGVDTVAVNIRYRYDRERILRITQVTDMDHAWELVGRALERVDGSVAFRISGYEETDFAQWVEDRFHQRPDLVMELPDVQASVYPQTGADRIVELDFTYDNSTEALAQMQKEVQSVFQTAELDVLSAGDVSEKYAKLFSFIQERFDYTIESSTVPAYSLLIQGRGDSRAFAEVYGAMCTRLGLECYVVSGTRNGEPWYWNMIFYRDAWHHLDITTAVGAGGFAPKSPSQMAEYEWEKSAYPN